MITEKAAPCCLHHPFWLERHRNCILQLGPSHLHYICKLLSLLEEALTWRNGGCFPSELLKSVPAARAHKALGRTPNSIFFLDLDSIKSTYIYILYIYIYGLVFIHTYVWLIGRTSSQANLSRIRVLRPTENEVGQPRTIILNHCQSTLKRKQVTLSFQLRWNLALSIPFESQLGQLEIQVMRTLTLCSCQETETLNGIQQIWVHQNAGKFCGCGIGVICRLTCATLAVGRTMRKKFSVSSLAPPWRTYFSVNVQFHLLCWRFLFTNYALSILSNSLTGTLSS